MLIIMLILGSCMCGIFFYKNGYKKYTLLYMFLSVPFIYFSLNMLDQAMTVDEWQYITAFIRMRDIERGSGIWIKGTYEYRVSEIFSGTLCTVLNKLFDVSGSTLILIYKYSHWLFFMGIILLTSQIWKMILDYDVDSVKYRVSNASILLVLIGSPLSCLLLKVCNYDAGCVFFGIAGLSLIILADKSSNQKMAIAGALISLFSCLEKWGGLPYWCICTSAVGALTYRSTKSALKAILADLKVIICSMAVCWLSLIYIRLLQGRGMVDINMGAGLFPLFFMVRAFFTLNTGYNTDLNYYDGYAWKGIAFLVMAIVVFSFALEAGRKLYDKCCTSRKNRIVWACLAAAIIFGGIAVSFVITRSQYPYVEIPENVYTPNPSMDRETTYFYNVQTRLGYFIAHTLYSIAVVITNQPTVYLILFLLACVAVIRSNKVQKDEYYFFLTEVLIFMLPMAYVLAGDPAVPRYFGVSILLMPILSIYIYGHYTDEDNGRKNIMMKKSVSFLLYALVLIEMIIYIPNYRSFSPLWLYRDEEFNTTVRQGEWAAGEAMMWGEDLAIAGNKVMDLIGIQDDYSQYTLYYSYGFVWLTDSGFNLKSMYSDFDELSWTENDYYIFAKYDTYRSEPPEFLTEVVPDATVSYKPGGGTAIWIYRGDRIKDYFF